MRHIMTLLTLLAWSCVAVTHVLGADKVDPIRVDPSTGHYVDSHGRTRIFHGMNVVYKKAPWYPESKTFDPAESLDPETMDLLREWGFNVVRLGVMWPGVEPALKQLDAQYMKAIVNLTEGLAERGIYTVADLHQDVGSRRFCGEGFPEHYVDALLQNESSLLARAMPFGLQTGIPLNATGYPSLEDCHRPPVDFAQYYDTYAVGALWTELYSPGTELNKGFLRYWTAVATAFRDAPQLLGYELLNEPSGVCLGGDRLGCLESGQTVFDNHVEANSLTPLYQGAAKAIRDAGAQQIILYEATVAPKVGAVKLFPDLPLGNDTQQGLAYHIYCFPGDGDNILADIICRASLALYYATYYPFLGEHKNVGGFMTEFGAVGGNPGELSHLDMLLQTADDHLQSWTYWMLKKYDDFTTANAAESLYDDAGKLEVAKLKTLSRTYAQAIAGLPGRMTFDPGTAEFHLDFVATVTSAPTVIYLNEDLYYPNGYVVEVQSTSCLVQHLQIEKNYLEFSLSTSPACHGKSVTLNIRPEANIKATDLKTAPELLV